MMFWACVILMVAGRMILVWLVELFKDIFCSNCPSMKQFNLVTDSIPVRVSPDMNNCLARPFDAEEVKSALFGMSPTKAPGFDGMHASFFSKILADCGTGCD